jgi:hypothetical protein
MSALNDEKGRVSLSLGLIERFYLAAASSSASSLPQLSAQNVLALVAPSAPDALARSLDPAQYIFGVHAYDDNQAFLIFKTSSYEQAFSGMLAWEPSMQKDLAPLFTRTPELHIQTNPAASSTAATSTATSAPQAPAVLPTGFQDAIIENHDARVIENASGDILLLWTFLDRNTLVIATNEATLREIISRLKNAPVVPLP